MLKLAQIKLYGKILLFLKEFYDNTASKYYIIGESLINTTNFWFTELMKDDNGMPQSVEELVPNFDRAEDFCGIMSIWFHYYIAF